MARGRQVNRQELAEVFGITVVTVDAWVRRGCPYVQRGAKGKVWKFDTAAVAEWRREQARDEASGVNETDGEDELKRRKLAVQIAAEELKLAKARELVAPLDQMGRAVATAFAEIKARMRSDLRSRLVARLLGETDERRFNAVVLEEVDQALESLADSDLLAGWDEDEDASEEDADGED